MAGGLVLGGANSKLGSSIGGALGNTFGKELAGGALGDALGKFSSALGPLGSIAGGVLGGALGGLLGSTKKGSATIGMGANGELVVTGVSGNSSSMKAAAQGGGNAAVNSIEQIAEHLGATIDASRGSVSIGQRHGDWRVHTTGRGVTKIKKGAVEFDDDYEAAVRFATMDLIKDGVITGLRDSTQRLLQAADDLETGLQRALDFESMFDRLKAYKDPVGSAVDGVDREFLRLRGIFTAEYAQLEELYGIERAAAVKEAGEKITASLKGLLDDLTINNDARSLRVRQAKPGRAMTASLVASPPGIPPPMTNSPMRHGPIWTSSSRSADRRRTISACLTR
jgi:hypothetical protein